MIPCPVATNQAKGFCDPPKRVKTVPKNAVLFLFLFLFIHLSQVPPKWREHIGELPPVVQCLAI